MTPSLSGPFHDNFDDAHVQVLTTQDTVKKYTHLNTCTRIHPVHVLLCPAVCCMCTCVHVLLCVCAMHVCVHVCVCVCVFSSMQLGNLYGPFWLFHRHLAAGPP